MRYLAIPLLAFAVASCTSSSSDEVLGTVGTQNASQGTNENPNDPGRLRNTRTALTNYCPRVAVRQGTGIYRVYPSGADENDTSQIRYQATIATTARECNYEGQDLRMRVGVRGRVINGPDGSTGAFALPIRVAVREGNRTIYSKLHKPQARIASGTSNAAFSFVDDEVVIPAPKKANIRVFVGFDEGPTG